MFTIEPMINQGSWRDVTWPDGWTSSTADGKRSAQFEHTLAVTKTGCDPNLTKSIPQANTQDMYLNQKEEVPQVRFAKADVPAL